MSRRIVWVDMARGLAMLTILWAHTSVYYADGFASSYTLMVLNALAVFFFVSGYLFMSPDKEFSVGHKLRSVFRSLVVPYLLFTLAMAFPKAVAHGSDVNLLSLIMPVLNGEASWFVSSLIVVQAYYCLVLFGRQFLCPKGGAGAFVFETFGVFLPFMVFVGFFRYCSNILSVSTIAMTFVFIGRLYRMVEWWFGNVLSEGNIRERKITELKHFFVSTCHRWCLPLLLVLASVLVYIKVWEWKHDVEIIFYVVKIPSFSLFYVDTLLSCLLVVGVCKVLPHVKVLAWLRWTGSHSLVFYFVCGGIPLLVSRVLPSFNGNVLLLLLAFSLVWVFSAVVAWVVYRFAPWVVGRRQ